MPDVVELTPAERAAAMVGPGQEDAVSEFLQELEQRDAAEAAPAAEAEAPADGEPELLAGKFKSPADLEKAYKELERKLGQRQQQQSEPEPAPEPLTREQAVGHYGESIVAAAEEAGIDLGAWDQAVKAGKDTTEQRQKLAEQTGIPAQLIEQYEAAFRPKAAESAASDSQAAGLTDADVSELKQLVGGDQEFTRLSQWAAANMGADELADYNAAVDSGNKAAVRLALRAMQARAAAGQQSGEPELVGGGTAPRASAFKTQEEALEAMRKTDGKGRNLYRNDPEYRQWYEKTMARSTFPA